MPRRSLLSAAERERLLAPPDDPNDLIRHYTLSESDLSVIRQRRGAANRLGFAVLLCYMRHPGMILGAGEPPFAPLLSLVARQLKVSPGCWAEYGQRDQTRREHLVELQAVFGFRSFTMRHYRRAVHDLDDLARQTDKGIVLAGALVANLRRRSILLPSVGVIERICAEAVTRATRRIHAALTEALTPEHRGRLDALLDPRGNSKVSTLAWLRQSPGAPNAKHLLEHIDRLRAIEALGLPAGCAREVHQNRLLKLAREGGQMTAQHVRELESTRRHATLIAVVLEAKATVIDEIVDLNDRIIGTLFNRARRNHEQQFQQSGQAINEKVRLFYRVGQALLEARRNGGDPFRAIEAVVPWEVFTRSVTEAEKLAQPEDFDYLHRIGDGYSQIRRYAPAFLEALHLKAAPAATDLLTAVETLKSLNADNTRKVPADAPTGFVRKRWQGLVFTESGVDRRFYELCTLSELKNALRSGDIWVQGSRQFKDFDEYLVPAEKFAALKQSGELPLAVDADCATSLRERFLLLEQQLAAVDRMARANELPDAIITESGLKITPLANSVPDEADALMQRAYGLLPHVKITGLLLEVDEWTGFTRHFTHIKSGEAAEDRELLLTTILSDAINLGLTKMAESCPGMTYARLSWLQAWHIRDETYSAALADLVNAQFRRPFADHWGDGTASSSDGQRFKAGGHAEAQGNVNPKYGSDPGVLFYTHVSDQYVPFHTKVINVGVRDATYVLDGLLYHESDLRIEEHYTDTAGFTDHVFALCHLLGFRFAPRIRDLADKRLFVPGKPGDYPALSALIGGTINAKSIRTHWDEILRLAASIRQGTVTASLMLRKLGSYPRQNGLAVALRELGRIERSLFTLDWLQDVELRRRVQAGLNKGEARNALARAVFFNRLGEVRDRSFENQRYRASGLNLVTAAIVLWNTVYLERAIRAIRDRGHAVDQALLQHLSPLGWEHINLTGDYVWRQDRKVRAGKFRPLRPPPQP
ncbi:MAG: Tn3 family transposase [Planctomycetaceae bacterium]|nr:Tn3 family transposase [Planctomycetaceae bacterium]